MAAQLAATANVALPVSRDGTLPKPRGGRRSGDDIAAFACCIDPTSFSSRAAAAHPAASVVHGRTTVARHRRGSRFVCYGTANGASVQDAKSALVAALEGVNRGIFGVSSQKKTEIEDLLKVLETLNPSPRPTENLDAVRGKWRLLYSSISILGVKRTKLGLRDFVSFGEFFQIIDVNQNRAVTKIGFNVAGLGMLNGALTIEAAFRVTSPTRVDIHFETSSISPERLFTLFKKNYDLLLGIFNPEGWLEITYVDETLRIGRDDKGNVFVLERV